MSVRFPLPSFIAPEAMANSWTYRESQNNSIHLDDSNRVVLNKLAKSPLNIVHHGEVDDLKALRSGFGFELQSDGRAYSILLEADVEDRIRAELILNEYDSLGERSSRNVIARGTRTLYVPADNVSHILLSLRFTGQGVATLRKVEFSGVAELDNAIPGLYPYEATPAAASYRPPDGSFQELRKFLTSDRKFLDAIASASTAEIASHLSQLEERTEALQEQLIRLNSEQKQTRYLLNHIFNTLSSRALDEALESLTNRA